VSDDIAVGDDLVQEFALIRTSGGSPDQTGGVHVQEESETTELDVAGLASRCCWRNTRKLECGPAGSGLKSNRIRVTSQLTAV
jgi:hypothetical protein